MSAFPGDSFHLFMSLFPSAFWRPLSVDAAWTRLLLMMTLAAFVTDDIEIRSHHVLHPPRRLGCLCGLSHFWLRGRLWPRGPKVDLSGPVAPNSQRNLEDDRTDGGAYRTRDSRRGGCAKMILCRQRQVMRLLVAVWVWSSAPTSGLSLVDSRQAVADSRQWDKAIGHRSAASGNQKRGAEGSTPGTCARRVAFWERT